LGCIRCVIGCGARVGNGNAVGTGEEAKEKEGRCKGIPLKGKVKVVDPFADLKVQVVDSFADIPVKKVGSFPDTCGEWPFVDFFRILRSAMRMLFREGKEG